jgi:predicted nucleic acid-binding protein
MSALRVIRQNGDQVGVSTQAIREFWNVATRPDSARGSYGRTTAQTRRWVNSFDRIFRLLPESLASYVRWRAIVESYGIIGVQVHDANVVAVAEVYGVQRIVTFNCKDFARYTSVEAVLPSELK